MLTLFSQGRFKYMFGLFRFKRDEFIFYGPNEVGDFICSNHLN